MSDSKTNVEDFLGELGAGAFRDKFAFTLSEAALAVCVNGNGKKKSKVSVELTLEQMGDNDQVIISHKLAKSVPTKRGKKIEEDTTESVFFVGKGGVMTINPPKEDMTGQYALKPVN